jgi:hypothetical protein
VEFQQRHIIKFLHLKDPKLQEIAAERSCAYRQDASARASMKYWLYEIQLRRIDLQTQHVAVRPPLDDVDVEVLLFPRQFPFF